MQGRLAEIAASYAGGVTERTLIRVMLGIVIALVVFFLLVVLVIATTTAEGGS